MDNAAPPTNRLSIAHLLVWMAVTGVMFGLFVQQTAFERREISESSDELTAADIAGFERLITGLSFLRGLVIPFEAIAVAGVLIWPWRRTQFRGGFPTQPGHFLLLAIGLGLVTDYLCRKVIWLALEPLIASSDEFNWTMIRLVNVLFGTIAIARPATSAAVIAFGVRRGTGNQLWNGAIYTLLVSLALICIGYILRATVGYPMLTALWAFILGGHILFVGGAMLAVVAWLQDLRNRVPRDIFHYLGLVVLAATIADRFGMWLIGRLV